MCWFIVHLLLKSGEQTDWWWDLLDQDSWCQERAVEILLGITKGNLLSHSSFPVLWSAPLRPGKTVSFSGSMLPCFMLDGTISIPLTIQKPLYPQNGICGDLFANGGPFCYDACPTAILVSDHSRNLDYPYFLCFNFCVLTHPDLLILFPKYLPNSLFFIPSTSSLVKHKLSLS